jgi:hypothetical protein
VKTLAGAIRIVQRFGNDTQSIVNAVRLTIAAR